MMEYVPMISYFLTNEMRLLCGLFLVASVMHFLPKRKFRPLTKSSQRSIKKKKPKKPKGKGSPHVEYNYINTTRKKTRR